MSAQDRETIAVAIKSLESAIDRIVERRAIDTRTHRHLRTLVRHVKHLLTQLVTKRESLRSLLAWFREEWDRLEVELPNHALKILPHAIQIFVRCQDGLTMLTSGECRHPGDTEEARKTKFPSRLSTLKERGDGYTCLYKADAVYSGFGWDEFANETVGIQARLVSCLKRYLKSPWEYLERHGAINLLESLLDQQESAVKELQQELQAMKGKIKQDITKRLRPTKLSFVTQDKMERLVVSYQQRAIRLERRADYFQIQGSVLPNQYQRASDWRPHALELQMQQAALGGASKRKRLVIAEDSETEDDASSDTKKKQSSKNVCKEAKPKVEKSSGLVVRVETAKPKTETEDSLTAIKAQMGADVKSFETSREELHLESTREGHSYEEGKVNRMRRILKRALARKDVDENEVWDARECLRQALMQLGNDCLWSSESLDKALESFRQAKSLVQEQQTSHRHSIENANDDTAESRYIQRDLLFRLGQASVNIGIVLYEWSQKEKAAKKKLNEGLLEFRKVQSLAEEMRRHAKADQEKCRVHSTESKEAMADILRADQLDSLACRWMGVALWPSSQQRAIEVLQKASSFFRSTEYEFRSYLMQYILEVSAECIYATCTLTDLLCSEMERLSRSSRQKGDEFLCLVTSALQRHVAISREIERLSSEPASASEVQLFQQENELASSKDIHQTSEDIKKWWQDIKRQPNVLTSKAPRLSSSMPRSDLFPDGAITPSENPTGYVLLSEASKRKQKRRNPNYRGKYTNTSQQDAVHALEDNVTSTQPPTRFRKWGDELLQQVESVDGMQLPRLAYPCVAPEIPPEIRAMMLHSQ